MNCSEMAYEENETTKRTTTKLWEDLDIGDIIRHHYSVKYSALYYVERFTKCYIVFRECIVEQFKYPVYNPMGEGDNIFYDKYIRNGGGDRGRTFKKKKVDGGYKNAVYDKNYPIYIKSGSSTTWN